MKMILSAALALAIIVAPAFAQTPAPTPAPASIEFNLAECTPRAFTKIHLTESTKDGKTTLTTTAYLASATEIKKDDDPDVWTVDKTEVDKDGTTKVTATMKLNDKIITLNLLTYKTRAVATITTDDTLHVALYGNIGPEAQLTENAEEDHSSCVGLVAIGEDGIPAALLGYLHQDDAPKAPPADVSSVISKT